MNIENQQLRSNVQQQGSLQEEKRSLVDKLTSIENQLQKYKNRAIEMETMLSQYQYFELDHKNSNTDASTKMGSTLNRGPMGDSLSQEGGTFSSGNGLSSSKMLLNNFKNKLAPYITDLELQIKEYQDNNIELLEEIKTLQDSNIKLKGEVDEAKQANLVENMNELSFKQKQGLFMVMEKENERLRKENSDLNEKVIDMKSAVLNSARTKKNVNLFLDFKPTNPNSQTKKICKDNTVKEEVGAPETSSRG